MKVEKEIPLGGRLTTFYPVWKEFCTDRETLDLIKGVKFEFVQYPVQHKLPRQIKMNKLEEQFMDEKILELLNNNSICEIPKPIPGGFVSNAFLVKKKSGHNQFRFIANLSKLNTFLKKRKFKMPGIKAALTLIKRDSYLASLDIESSFFSHLSIRPKFRKFVVFQWKGKTYMFKCLGQGSPISPVSFVSVTRPLTKYLQCHSISIFLFVDDSLLTAPTIACLKANLQLTIDLFEGAGFLLNYKKSQMQPTKQMEFLGFLIDTATYTISLTQDKRKGIFRCITRVLDNPSKPITIRFLATIIGKIVATFPCSHDAPLHYRILDRFKVESQNEEL